MKTRNPEPGQGVWRGLGWLLLLALFAGQIWVLYVMVPGPGEPLFPGQDKVGHALLFAVPFGLALLLRSRLAVLGVIGHALLSEPLQALFTSTRVPDPWDLVANLVGIALALTLVWLVMTSPRVGSLPGAVRDAA